MCAYNLKLRHIDRYFKTLELQLLRSTNWDHLDHSETDSAHNSDSDRISLTATATQTKMPKLATRCATQSTTCRFRLSVIAVDTRENLNIAMDK